MVTPVDPSTTVASVNMLQMQAPVAPGMGTGLSDTAQAALSRVAEMQTEFRMETARAQDLRPDLSRPTDGSAMEDLTARLVQQMETSTRIQAQIAEFTMAASISSSFGRDLNMFLRGQ